MSTRADVIVLGAGMVGVSAALHLQRRGRDVFLIDRRGAGEETSYGNAGLIQREAVIPYIFPREFGVVLGYAMNNRRDVVYHLSALPRIAPWQSVRARDGIAASRMPIMIVRCSARLVSKSPRGQLPWGEDTPGALWSHGVIDATRQATAPNLARIVVAIDPAATSGEEADGTGIVIVGNVFQGRGYVLADASGKHQPVEWAKIAISAYRAHSADRIVAERHCEAMQALQFASPDAVQNSGAVGRSRFVPGRVQNPLATCLFRTNSDRNPGGGGQTQQAWDLVALANVSRPPVKAFAHRARKFLCTSASPCGRSSRCGCIPALLCLAPFRSGP
jgi:hypothetical protein